MYSDLEKDKVFLTKRAKRCLGQNGTFRACPLPDSVVEPFDVGCKTRLFTNGFVLFVRHNSLVGFPEIAVADALLVAFGNRTPELLTGCLATSTDHTGHDLPGLPTQSQPYPALSVF